MGQLGQFRFLTDEEFDSLDLRGRAAYLFRAQQEIAERRRVLRDQMNRTLGSDTDATIPVPDPERNDGRSTRAA